MLFFSSPKFQKTQVVIGQYLGIGLLIIISALGSLLTDRYEIIGSMVAVLGAAIIFYGPR